jgi:hypothetical protein
MKIKKSSQLVAPLVGPKPKPISGPPPSPPEPVGSTQAASAAAILKWSGVPGPLTVGTISEDHQHAVHGITEKNRWRGGRGAKRYGFTIKHFAEFYGMTVGAVRKAIQRKKFDPTSLSSIVAFWQTCLEPDPASAPHKIPSVSTEAPGPLGSAVTLPPAPWPWVANFMGVEGVVDAYTQNFRALLMSTTPDANNSLNIVLNCQAAAVLDPTSCGEGSRAIELFDLLQQLIKAADSEE